MFHYQKEFVKKKVSGDIAFDVISWFHIKIQEPARGSTTTRAFVFPAKFYYQEILKEEVDDDLSVCIDERSPCGLAITRDKGLSMSCDQKVMMLLLPIQKCPIVFYLGVAFTA